MGVALSSSSVLAHVCAQLLGHPRRRHPPSMESLELRHPVQKSSVRSSLVPHRTHRSGCNDSFCSSRLPAGILSLLSRRTAQRTSLSTCDRAFVGQLSRPWLRVENYSRQRWRAERISPVPAHHARPCLSASLQPIRGSVDAHAYLHAICFSADLRFPRAHSACAH